MFTGLIEEMGQIYSLKERGSGRELYIKANQILDDVKVGDSIAIDGVCLTVEYITSSGFSAQAVGETLARSTLGSKVVGDSVNLERALKASERFGGHFVQGHVDGIAEISTIEKADPGYWLAVRIPESLTQYIVEKGSIALDGLSLTVARLDSTLLTVAIIPHTWQVTTLKSKHIGDVLNVEVDILAKYIRNFMHPYQKVQTLTLDKLSELGF